jgi:hypothetical protein
MNIFSWFPGYTDGIYNEGKEPMLLLFIAYLITFIATRVYTRLARVYNWGSGSAGGVHVHHMVPGVVLMAVCGALGFSTIYQNGIAADVLAIGFGVGTALVLDEFAMIFHVRDVYWTEEGRTSIDAMFMGFALAGLLLVGFAPLDFERGSTTSGSELSYFFLLIFNASVAAITFLKKKPFMGMVALLVPTIGMFTAIRLAKPGSPWSHWFYESNRGSPRKIRKRRRKLERSIRRFDQGWPGRFERWFSDIVGGAPTLPSQLEAKGDHEP